MCKLVSTEIMSEYKVEVACCSIASKLGAEFRDFLPTNFTVKDGPHQMYAKTRIMTGTKRMKAMKSGFLGLQTLSATMTRLHSVCEE